MKQSTKLLSLLLAVIIAFSCMSVIGSAILVKSEITYDSIDDADLSYQQVADLAMDMIDELLVDADIGEVFNLLGIRLDLSNVNTTFETVYGLKGILGTLGFLLGDVGDLNVTALAGGTDSALQRQHNNDYRMISALLQFLADNASVLSQVAYGIGSDGLSLGLIGSFLALPAEITGLLGDLPGLLVGMVYDLIIYGSEGYDKSIDDLKATGTTLTATYPEVDTLDEMVPTALYNLLTKPQEYEKNAEGVRVWDPNSIIMPDLPLTKDDINPLKKSFFQILDVAAQIAIDEIGVPALNNNLKKALMLAVEAELNEIDVSALPEDVETAFEIDVDEAKKSYVTYFAYDKMAKSGGKWYYTTRETEAVLDANGEPEIVNGKEVTEKKRYYYVVNMGAANEFASFINWDWEFVGSDVAKPTANQTALIYDDFKTVDGSFVGGLNNLLGMVYNVGLSETAKADFVKAIKENEIDKDFTGWITGENSNINTNVEYLVKYILTEFGDKVFGSDSPYAKYTMAQIKDKTVLDIVAMIGPGFFEDALPQIILPKDPATGEYAFHKNVQVWEFAAIVLRELMTGIAPIVNYDSVIFANGDVTSANDRQFVDYEQYYIDNPDDFSFDYTFEYEQAQDDWFNIILNMGTDLGLVYLQQITNFEDFCDVVYGGDAKDFDLDGWIRTGGGKDPSHWQTNLNAAILWALDYIGSVHNTGVLDGITYDILNGETYAHPFDKISYIFNKILPLGFVGNGAYTSETYDLDARLLVDGVKQLLSTFDLNVIFSLLGRNQASDYNLLDDASLGTAVLDLVNRILKLVFGTTILQNVNTTGSVTTQVIHDGTDKGGVISRPSLQTTVQALLGGLNNRKDSILINAAPVIAKLIKSWGGEQEFKRPENDLGIFRAINENGTTYNYVVTKTDCNGNPSEWDSYEDPITVNVSNESVGVWRHYKLANGTEGKDEQYKIQLTGVEFTDYDGSESDYIHDVIVDTTTVADYGKASSFTFRVGATTKPDGTAVGAKSAIPEEGVVQIVKISYVVYLEGGQKVTDDAGNTLVFTDESYVWFSRYPADENETVSGNRLTDGLLTDGQNGSCTITVQNTTYVPYSNAANFLANFAPVTFDSTGTEKGNPTMVLVFNIDGTEKNGFKPSSVTSDETNENISYGSIPLKIFQTYTANWKNSMNLTVSGSAPTTQEAFEAAVPFASVNSADGVQLSWTFNATIKGDEKISSNDFSLRFYDDLYRDKLYSLVHDEAAKMRKMADYDTTATVVMDTALKNENETVDGKEVLRETNFDTNADGVTVIKCNEAWTEYYNAFAEALKVGYPEWNDASRYDFKAQYDRLQVAVNDLDRCPVKATSVAGEIDEMEDALRAAQARTTDKYNHTDYKMYRHNKFNDARSDAQWYIDLRKDAQPTLAEISKYFGYNWMEMNDFYALIKQHTVKYGEHAGETIDQHKYYDYLNALLEDFTEEELEEKKLWLDNKKKEFANVTMLDVAMAENYLKITEERLLTRDCGIIYTQLNDEITSAQNMIGITNGAKGITYTDGSWKNYKKAYDDAVAAQNCGSQKQVFDAKYQLCVQRKNLVKVGDAADYAELNALIAQAEFVLANPGLYESKVEGMPINKVIGMVLAELGMDKITSVDGYDVNLFPGSAYDTVAAAYGKDDQNKVNDAAWVLKEALARLTFKDLAVTDVKANKLVERETLVKDEDANDGKDTSVTALVSHIAAKQDETNVKSYFKVEAENLNVTEVVVSNDVNFAVSYVGQKEFKGFAGTNSTVTFYTTVNDVKLPVATVKIVVDGDINGDGVVDGLDAAYAALISAEKGELEGCYFLAGDIAKNGAVDGDDYGAIVNLAVGRKAS